MPDPAPRLFFDYVDPCSFVVELRLRRVEEALGVEAARHPYELLPPPTRLPDLSSREWDERWERAREAAAADGLELVRPALVPWSRKAQELVLFAREQGGGRELHDAVYRAYHQESRDIGRVDVLVELAVAAGFDRTAAKASLDVDRHLETVRELRRVAERLGVRGVPTLLSADRTATGIPDANWLRSFLGSAPDDEPPP